MGELHSPRADSSAEQRQARRVQLDVRVECRTRKTCVHGESKNISESGILVLAGETFREGDAVFLRFALPPKPQGPIIHTEGIVVRANEREYMAIQFVGLHNNHRSAIAQFVARYLDEAKSK